MGAFPIVVVDGPRGVGKTTSALRLASSVVNLPEDLDRLKADPAGYLGSLPAPVLLDEWQLAGTDLLWTLKRIVDREPAPGRFLLTGSVEPATYGPTQPLTGRAARLVLRPISIAELDGHGQHTTFLERVARGELPAATAGRPSRFSLRWLTRAGFPGTRAMPDPALFLESYAALVAQRAGDEGRDASRLLKALRVLATFEAEAVPDQRIWEAADINKVTWSAYKDLLERTHLYTPSPAFESNRLKRLTRYPKRHLADVALALTLAGLGAERLERDPSAAGHYLEAFVMQQLRPQADAVGAALFHLRTGAGEREVDVVAEIGEQIVAFGVKHATQPRPADAASLAWLRDQLPDRFRAGCVLHTGGDTFPLGERLWECRSAHLPGRLTTTACEARAAGLGPTASLRPATTRRLAARPDSVRAHGLVGLLDHAPPRGGRRQGRCHPPPHRGPAGHVPLHDGAVLRAGAAHRARRPGGGRHP
jgi:predicted AAA+ superfamily ATPase